MEEMRCNETTHIYIPHRDGTKAAMLLMVSFGRSIGGIKKTGRHHDNIRMFVTFSTPALPLYSTSYLCSSPLPRLSDLQKTGLS